MINGVTLLLMLMNAMVTIAVALILWRVKRQIMKNEASRVEREICREMFSVHLLKMSVASILLGEATAIAIRDGKQNGEVKDALDYAKELKKDCREYLETQGIKSFTKEGK